MCKNNHQSLACQLSWVLMLVLNFGLQAQVKADSFSDFFKAAKIDDAPAIHKLIQRGMDPNIVNENGKTALHEAILSGANQVALELIHAKSIDLEMMDARDENALMLAALKNNEIIIQALLEADVNVNQPGWTALHYAASKGNIKAMQMLLDADAYIDAESPNKTTPLMMASGYAGLDAVKLLIEAGADPSLLNDKHMTAIDFALQNQSKSVATYLSNQLASWHEKYPISIPSETVAH